MGQLEMDLMWNRADSTSAEDMNLYLQKEGYIFYFGIRIPYKVVKSSRHTMAISVSNAGGVVVRIPNKVSYEKGHDLAKKKSRWIYGHYIKIREELQNRIQFQWVDGAGLELYGEDRLLRVQISDKLKKAKVEENGREIVVTCVDSSEEMVKSAVKNWYKMQARNYLNGRTSWWALRMGVKFERISIRDQATRWGSCSSRGNINFNWRLVLLPEDLANYVVVHELAHLKELNHSKDFWKLVEQELPDYMQRRRRLKDHEIQINSKY